jgi:hypothetical protein
MNSYQKGIVDTKIVMKRFKDNATPNGKLLLEPGETHPHFCRKNGEVPPKNRQACCPVFEKAAPTPFHLWVVIELLHFPIKESQEG